MGVGRLADALTDDKELCILATVRCMEMAYGNKFNHTRPNGEKWESMGKEDGFDFTAPSGGLYCENLAYGYETADKAMDGRHSSETH